MKKERNLEVRLLVSMVVCPLLLPQGSSYLSLVWHQYLTLAALFKHWGERCDLYRKEHLREGKKYQIVAQGVSEVIVMK